jgi:UPF0755 protein
LNEDKIPNGLNKNHVNLGRKIFLSIIVILIILGVSIFIFGHQYLKQSLKPLNPKDNTAVQVHIPMGASDKKIGSILQDKKIVKSGMVFDYYVNSHKYSNLKAGYYEFSPSMGLSTIANKLSRGGSDQPLQGKYGKLLVREGDSIDVIAKTLEQRSRYSSGDFKALMTNKVYLAKLKTKYPKLLTSAFNAKNTKYILEGYLYPATYNAQKNISLEQIINQMVAKTNQEFSPYFDKIKKKSLTVQEALTLSSIIEKEHVDSLNRQKISGVLYNRLNNKLPLAVKSSIVYANGKELVGNITKKDYDTKSEFNLFKNIGFGPGPIGSSTKKSLLAVLYPKDMNKGYFTFSVKSTSRKVSYSNNYMNINQIINDNVIMK